jgi:hypothetical protein
MNKSKKVATKTPNSFKIYYVAAILYIFISVVLTFTKPQIQTIWISLIFTWMICNGLFLIYLIWKKVSIRHALVPTLFLFDFLISSNLAFVISQYDLTLLSSPAYTVALLIIPIIILGIAIRRLIK